MDKHIPLFYHYKVYVTAAHIGADTTTFLMSYGSKTICWADCCEAELQHHELQIVQCMVLFDTLLLGWTWMTLCKQL